MGQKVNPIIQRIGIIKDWSSSWYAGKKRYGKMFHEDLDIREFIEKRLKDAGVSKIEVLRSINDTTINVYVSRPGMAIGRDGSGIDAFREELERKFKIKCQVNIKEIHKPDLDAKLLGESVAKQVERRMPYRRAAKTAIQKAIEAGAKGAKMRFSGRLNGVEIARSEFFSEGKIPLHTFRADIDYYQAEADTTYGKIGIKVWIYKGDVFKKESTEQAKLETD